MRWGLERWALWGFAGLAVLAWISPFAPQLGYLIAGADLALLLVIALDGVLLIGAGGISLRRVVPTDWSEGETGTVTIEAWNPTRRALALSLFDTPPELLGVPEPRRLPLTVPASSSSAASYDLSPARRGHDRFGTLSVTVSGPLRLVRRRIDVELLDPVRVLPNLGRRDRAVFRSPRLLKREGGKKRVRRVSTEGEFERLRSYVPGDDPRHVDWMATARRGEPVTRVFVPERAQRVVIALDAGRGMGLISGGRSLFDHAANAAMRLTGEVLSQGDAVALTAWDHEPRARVPLGSSPSRLKEVGIALAEVASRRDATDFPSFFRDLAARHRRRSLIVVLTELGMRPQQHSLERALPALRGRHLVMIVDLLDPAIEDLVTAPPEQDDDLFSAAAAAELLAERRVAAARLRALGLPVIVERPDRVGSSLVQHYLDLKRAGSI